MLPDLFLVLHNTVTCTCLSLSWNCRLTVWNCFLLCMCVCLLCRRESNSFVKTSRLRCINTCRLLDYQASCRLKVTDLSPVFVFSRRRGRRKPATVQTLLKKPTSAGWWTPVNTGRALHPSGPSARKKTFTEDVVSVLNWKNKNTNCHFPLFSLLPVLHSLLSLCFDLLVTSLYSWSPFFFSKTRTLNASQSHKRFHYFHLILGQTISYTVYYISCVFGQSQVQKLAHEKSLIFNYPVVQNPQNI